MYVTETAGGHILDYVHLSSSPWIRGVSMKKTCSAGSPTR